MTYNTEKPVINTTPKERYVLFYCLLVINVLKRDNIGDHIRPILQENFFNQYEEVTPVYDGFVVLSTLQNTRIHDINRITVERVYLVTFTNS